MAKAPRDAGKKPRRMLGMDVVEAARWRINRIYDAFDTVVVSFSGGKDSLVSLYLVKEIAEQRGQLPLDVIFRDEEVIPDEVVDFVDHYRREPWVRMRWYAVPLKSNQVVLGNRNTYIQWDPDREWVRQPPEWSIRLEPGDKRVFTQHTMDGFASQGYEGKVCFITGVRAAESLMRLNAICQKKNEPYIAQDSASKGTRVSLGRPIYDWQEKDIFKYLYDEEIEYCEVYEQQNLAGVKGGKFRVSTPLHSEAARVEFGEKILKKKHPDFYARLLKVFPEMSAHERYSEVIDYTHDALEYAVREEKGAMEYIRDHIKDPAMARLAYQQLARFRSGHRKNPLAYPWYSLLAAFTRGQIERPVQPLTVAVQRSISKKVELYKASLQ